MHRSWPLWHLPKRLEGHVYFPDLHVTLHEFIGQTKQRGIGEKFSAAFDRCAGELRITQHEDYEKWAIDILVKFRDSEKLQVLTAQRHSGGERSLTTILYLMSSTEEARAPVHEINQGVDNRAERMVHNSMVEVTCKAEAAHLSYQNCSQIQNTMSG
ncbi:hypothetical protein JOM56_005507 [Amanita muscaria]